MKFLTVDVGPALVQKLLPQRPPFLMVDRIEAYRLKPEPALRASRFLTANESMFVGHFPGLPLLPGAMLMEGLGQTASLLFSLSTLLDEYEQRGAGLDDLVADLQNLDLGFRLDPGYRAGRSDALLEAQRRISGFPVGVAGSIQLKFLRPVTPGNKLVYEVVLKRRLGQQLHFVVEALVDDRPVARGTLSAAIVQDLPMPRSTP